jgi:hypothetical protein
MSYLGVATAQADFAITGTTKTTTAAQIGPYVAEGVNCGELGYQAAFDFAANSEVWMTFYLYGSGSNSFLSASSSGALATVSSGSTGLLRLYNNATNGQRMEYWNGSSWTSLSPIAAMTVSIRYKISIYIKLHDTAGVFRIYIDNNLLWEYTGDTILAGLSTVNRVTFSFAYASAGPQGYNYSALVVATHDTRDTVVNQCQFASNGTNTAWANDYVNVTKTGVDDSALISSDTANQVETYNQADINAALSGLDVAAVVIPMRCRKGDSGPSNIQGVARVSGTDYFSANLNPSTGFELREAIFTTNPATSQPWTISEVNGAEFGFKSIA